MCSRERIFHFLKSLCLNYSIFIGLFILRIFSFLWRLQPNRGLWPPHSWGFLRSHTDTPQSVGLLWTSDQPVAETSTWQHTTLTTDKHPCPGGIRTHNLSRRAAADVRLRPRGHWDRRINQLRNHITNSHLLHDDLAEQIQEFLQYVYDVKIVALLESIRATIFTIYLRCKNSRPNRLQYCDSLYIVTILYIYNIQKLC